jgi:deoxyribonuclease-4
MSVAGGIHTAFDAGARVGCDCLQIFVKNQRQWSAAPLTEADIEAYRRAERQTGLFPVVAHATYLLNLASPDPSLRRRSIDGLILELRRCAQLGVPYLVLHPGAHMGQGVRAGIKRIVRSLDTIHKDTRGINVQILLETTAGQGSSVGHEIEQLGWIINDTRAPDRLGVCVDTCHVFAAGYNIADSQAYERLVADLRRHVTLERVKCFHVNDSMRECGSRVDRHEHIGKGKIGKAGFAHLVNDPRFAAVPKILETPKGTDGRGTDLDKVNLKRLRNLIR